MFPVLLGITLALPASGQTTRVELDAAVQLDAHTMDTSVAQPNPPNGQWLGGNGTFGISVFGRRLVDDETAPSLQPFLQRVARFHVEGGGGGASIRYPMNVLPGPEPRYGAALIGGRVETSAEGYVGRWVYLAAHLGIAYQRWERDNNGVVIGAFNPTMHISQSVAARLDSTELLVSPAVSIGVRWRDLLVSAGWGVSPYRIGSDAMRVGFWGGAFVGVRAVVRSFVDLACV